MPIDRRLPRPLAVLLAVLLAQGILAVSASKAQSTNPAAAEAAAASAGPVRLRTPSPNTPQLPGSMVNGGSTTGILLTAPPTLPTMPPELPPGEFERYVQRLIDPTRADTFARNPDGTPLVQTNSEIPKIRRFGADLVMRVDDSDAAEDNPLIPTTYTLKPGDEVVVTLWGSVDAEVRAVVDRSGRITIPRVGPVFVSGVRYADLADTIRTRVSQTFRSFDLSVSLGRLRGVRVFVTGYVARPGAYGVTSLSTLTVALARAGGPTAAGSFRAVNLMRGKETVSTFDVYDFLLKGDRSADRLLESGDVIQVGPVGAQVALIGSINQPAIFEMKPGETVADVLSMAGGFSALGDRSRLSIERLTDRSSVRIRELSLPADNQTLMTHGDVMRAFSVVDTALPIQRQNKRVRVDGEVQNPGDYVMPPNSTLADAIKVAGGLTSAAFLFGTEFSRESVRLTQQDNYERALRDLETDFTRAATTQRTSNAEEAAAASARGNATQRLIERLRSVKPSGRVVLQMQPGEEKLPELALEDGDRLRIPPRATTIGVFGSVFNGGSYLYNSGRMVDDYLRLAGGPTRGADPASAFVIRANGSVISGRQRSGFWSAGELAGVPAMPGDTVFVPEEVNKTTFVQNVKDWTQILYQLGIGLAGISSFR